MKVLIFTHEQDIDGIGCLILARKAFKKIDFELCKTFEITDKVKRYIDSNKIYDYDKIYVTDLCIKEPVLSFINSDDVLKNKLIVLDHHKTELDEGNNKYDFVNIIVEKNNMKVSGTSLFYDYLVSNKYLEKSTILDIFVEWTRQYDVWDWKNANNYEARKLHILFETQGYEKYITTLERIINNEKSIVFNDEEEKIVLEFDKKLCNDMNLILNKMVVKELVIDEVIYKIGFVMSPYCYRNDIDEFIRKDNKYNIDIVGMIMTDMETVSYRNVKDVDVSKVAVYFDGKGHKGAATNLQSNEKFKDILNEVKNANQKKVVKVVAALIEKDGKYLIAKRSTGDVNMYGKWEFPGGKVAYNEDEFHAIEREIKEEFDLNVKATKFIANDVCEYSDKFVDLRLYECKYVSGSFKLHDHSMYKWVTLNEIMNYDLCPADVNLCIFLNKH